QGRDRLRLRAVVLAGPRRPPDRRALLARATVERPGGGDAGPRGRPAGRGGRGTRGHARAGAGAAGRPGRTEGLVIATECDRPLDRVGAFWFPPQCADQRADRKDLMATQRIEPDALAAEDRRLTPGQAARIAEQL